MEDSFGSPNDRKCEAVYENGTSPFFVDSSLGSPHHWGTKGNFKISVPNRKLSKRNGSQFCVAAWIGNQNAVFTRRRKWKRIWKCHLHWNSDAHGPHWLIMEIFYCDFSALLTHPSLFRLVDWFCQAVRQQKNWLSVKAQLQCTKTRPEWQWRFDTYEEDSKAYLREYGVVGVRW